MPFKEQKYKPNQTTLKVFGYGDNKKIKVTNFKMLRTAGIEVDEDFYSLRGMVNDEKLSQSIIRARSKIFELAFCNPWQFFFTGTIDSTKYDRTDLEKYHKDISQHIRDLNKKYKCKIDFLFVPELHSDKQSWHLHGFINGLPPNEIKQFQIGDTMGKAIADKVKKGEAVYSWLSYQKKFGFCDLEPIRNQEAISKYITKYINKNLASSVKELNAHLYYHSRGLKEATEIKRGTMSANIAPDFKNDYCAVAWLPYTEKLLQELLESFN